MADVRSWLRDRLPQLLDEITALDLVLPYLKARSVLKEEDCADIRRELGTQGSRASVELCLVRVFKQDVQSGYHNFLVSLSLPFPRLYSSLHRGMKAEFGDQSVQGLPAPQQNLSLPNSDHCHLQHRARDVVAPDDELIACRRRIDTLTIEVDGLRTELASDRSLSDGLRQELSNAQHQYQTAKRERFEALDDRDRAIAEAYGLNDRLDEALRDNDELAAKNDGLNVQLRLLDDVMRERDEALADLEKTKRQRDQASAERKKTAERLALTQRDHELALRRHEEEIREYERKGEGLKRIGKELQTVQMEKMELQLEIARLRKAAIGMKEASERTGRQAGYASPWDSGVSGDLKTVDMVKVKVVLDMLQDDTERSRTDAGIVLENGLLIRRLPREGMAAIDGQLVVGDRLVEMNGLDLSGMKVEDVHSLIHACKSELTLTIVRAMIMRCRLPTSPRPQHSSHALFHTRIPTFHSFSHHTRDNLSLKSFAYNPDDRPTPPRRRQNAEKFTQEYRNPGSLHVSASVAGFRQLDDHRLHHTLDTVASKRIKQMKITSMRKRSLSSPPRSEPPPGKQKSRPPGNLSSASCLSDVSSNTLLAGHKVATLGTPGESSSFAETNELSLRGLSASQILRANESDTEEEGDQPLFIRVRSPSMAEDESTTQSESTDPGMLAGGMPTGGVSLTVTDMRLATRGPDIIINPPASPLPKKDPGSRKMPTFLKDPQMLDAKKYRSQKSRFIELKASSVTSDIGFDVIGGRGHGIIISRIHAKVHEEAGLLVGDQLLELNGISLENATYEKASATLSFATFGGGAILCVEFNEKKYRMLKPTDRDDFYVRALFDHVHPEPGEMAFREGDILHVVDTMVDDKIDVWLAKRCIDGRSAGEKGSIPSKNRARLLHGPQMMKRNSSFPPPMDLFKRRGSSTFQRFRTRMSLLRPNIRRMTSHEAEAYSSLEVPPNESIGSVSVRSSESAGSQGSFENEPVVPVMNAMALLEGSAQLTKDDSPAGYQYVEKVSYDFLRPVLIVGPLASVLVNRLSQEDPMKYCSALPEFIESHTEVEEGLRSKSIIFSSQRSRYGASYSCITSAGIKQIADEHQHCLLDIGPECITRLKAAGMHPIVIYLSPKSEKKLRSSCMQCNIPSVEARTMFEEAKHLHQQYHVQFTAEVSLGSLIDRCLMRVRETIQMQQNKVDWIPVPE